MTPIPVFTKSGDSKPNGYAVINDDGQIIIVLKPLSALVIQGQAEINNIKGMYFELEFIKNPGDIAQEKIDRIHELHARGYSDSFIARQVGFEEISVRAFIKAKQKKDAREMRGR